MAGMLLFSVCVASGIGDWEMCGPGGDKVNHLCNVPGTVFAAVDRLGSGTGYECYKSLNGGENWQFVSLIDTGLNRLITDAHQRLVGWRLDKIIISADMGESWSTIMLDPGEDIRDVASDPVDSSRFLAIRDGNDSSPLLESDDGGLTWNTVEGLPCMDGRHVEFSTVDPDRVYLAAMGDESSDFLLVYTSSDGGLTWSDVSPSELPVETYVRDLTISPFDADVVFIGVDNDLILSTDCGENWTTALSASHAIREITFHPSNPDSVFACTTNDVYLSGNGGLSWWINPNPCDLWYITSISVSTDPYTHVHLGSYDGLALSINGGYDWSAVNNGIPGGCVYAMLEDTETGFPVFAGNGFFLNEEQYSWTEVDITGYILPSHIVRSNSDPDLWFAAGDAG